MYFLLKKEINSFLNSLIGYLVIFVFLLMLSLFLWVFPGDSNILDAKFSSLDGLFAISPYLFIFLIPALTMKSFSEEKKTGTIEFLLTKPFTELQIVLAKYFAGVILVLLSLLPTFVYYFSVYQLGNPPGNIDTGATNGSFIGLFLLASAFVSIGIFASSITENQVIAFLIGIFISYLFLDGLQSIAQLSFLKFADSFFNELSLNYHYLAMSRGVVDSRDLLFFISFNLIFILSTKLVITSRKW